MGNGQFWSNVRSTDMKSTWGDKGGIPLLENERLEKNQPVRNSLSWECLTGQELRVYYYRQQTFQSVLGKMRKGISATYCMTQERIAAQEKVESMREAERIRAVDGVAGRKANFIYGPFFQLKKTKQNIYPTIVLIKHVC